MDVEMITYLDHNSESNLSGSSLREERAKERKMSSSKKETNAIVSESSPSCGRSLR